MDIKSYIRSVPDFPQPGINFRDITPLLGDARALRHALDGLAALCQPLQMDVIVGIEARGFLFAAPLACALNLPLVPVRKPGKLPCATCHVSYELEYGTDTLEMHVDAIAPGQRALIVDDVLATGNTAAATGTLVRERQGQIAGYAFLIELTGLNGRQKLQGTEVVSLIQYG